MIGIDAISAANLSAVAARVRRQINDGVTAVRDGDLLLAELHFSVAIETLRKLQEALEGIPNPPPPKPLRKLCLVGDRAPDDGEDLPEWMGRKNGDPTDAA